MSFVFLLKNNGNVNIHDNTAEFGGAIWIGGGEFTISGQTEIYNNSSQKGGAIVSKDLAELYVKDKVKIHDNNAIEKGGAIALIGGKCTLSGETNIYNNFARKDGAVAHGEKDFEILEQAEIYDNYSLE